MPRAKVDSKGRVVVPKEERTAWQASPKDAVRARVETDGGRTVTVRDTLDSKGRITLPKERRQRNQIEHGDRLTVSITEVQEGGYTCDDCGESFDIGKVLIVGGGDRVVCAPCSTPSDRVV